MREIVLDTETTGINPRDGHRIIEIGALELINHTPTGAQLHLYINPEREVDAGAFEVHGISNEFLADKPVFADVADEFQAFVGDDMMVIHNASFDVGFINAELERLGRAPYPMTQAVDTLAMARKKFPGAQANLNALCRRFEIDNGHRDLHGALIDADLLAEVYIELLGGRQPGLSLDPAQAAPRSQSENNDVVAAGFEISDQARREPRPHAPTEEERQAHAAFLETIKEPVWHQS